MKYSSIDAFLSIQREKKLYPFHMPGHKQNAFYLQYDLSSTDITEIPGADNLHHPEGIILQAQEKVAQLCHAEKSFLMVNGSSSGIMAAILAVCRRGDSIIVQRDSHKSVYNGLILSGATPIYMNPNPLTHGIFGGVAPDTVERVLKENPEAQAVLITSPTYEGICAPIKKIAEIVHRYQKILIVDEAHGAHLGFHPYFPPSANMAGADIVIQSFHKTLPALNQSAVLHCNGDIVDTMSISRYVSIMQTTSPSYLLLSSMERVADDILSNGVQRFGAYAENLKNFRDGFRGENRALQLLDQNKLDFPAVYDLDPGKLVFLLNSNQMNGKNLEEQLSSRYGIQIELYGLRHIIAMTSYADTKEGFAQLKKGIEEIDKDLNFCLNGHTIEQTYEMPKQVLTPCEAIGQKSYSIPISSADSKIAADFVIPYPPGIPLIAPGEAYNKEVIQQILSYVQNHVHVMGIEQTNGIYIHIIK